MNRGKRSDLCIQMLERPYICLPLDMTVGELKLYILQLPVKVVDNSTGCFYKGQVLTIDEIDIVFVRDNKGVSKTLCCIYMAIAFKVPSHWNEIYKNKVVYLL